MHYPALNRMEQNRSFIKMNGLKLHRTVGLGAAAVSLCSLCVPVEVNGTESREHLCIPHVGKRSPYMGYALIYKTYIYTDI